jgi:hypothetical protein
MKISWEKMVKYLIKRRDYRVKMCTAKERLRGEVKLKPAN